MKSLSPLMKQYREIKKAHEDSILFFRVGDFYEMFFEDAVTASKILEIALTSRDKNQAEPIPLCGIPFHAAQAYIAKLIKAGKNVAICDQVEEASQAKGLVRREVVRVITPGTLIEPELLHSKENHFFASIFIGASGSGLGFADLSTGEFRISQFDIENHEDELWAELARLEAREILIGETTLDRLKSRASSGKFNFHFRRSPDSAFDPEMARQTLLEHFKTQSLAGFGCEAIPLAVSAGGALIRHLRETQRQSLAHIRSLKTLRRGTHMEIDPVAQKNLEMIRRLSDQRPEGSLLRTLDKTETPMGGRLLRNWLIRPLMDIKAIHDRLDAVENFFENTTLRMRLQDLLKPVGDMERLIGRIALGTATGRDLVHLKNSLEQLPPLFKTLSDWRTGISKPLPPLVQTLFSDWDDLNDVQNLIGQTLVDDPPPGLQEGGLIRTGVDPVLDEFLELARNGKQWISNLESKERDRTGIETLKIRSNQV
ncbi:MAG TPA: DNA mismatch repair protein MutS, partial [Nitrospiria bacterium]|nr:DNA mismatch repair protein MutS [Nitrospiria bacterium]